MVDVYRKMLYITVMYIGFGNMGRQVLYRTMMYSVLVAYRIIKMFPSSEGDFMLEKFSSEICPRPERSVRPGVPCRAHLHDAGFRSVTMNSSILDRRNLVDLEITKNQLRGA